MATCKLIGIFKFGTIKLGIKLGTIKLGIFKLGILKLKISRCECKPATVSGGSVAPLNGPSWTLHDWNR